jgi:hypothetical protein
MKLPNPSFPYFVLKRLPSIEGIYWVVVFPVAFLLYYFFSVWFLVFLSWHVVFPFNVLVWLLIPTMIFVVFLRIQFERTVAWWKGLKSPSKEWDVSKAIEELAELQRRQRQRRQRKKLVSEQSQ